MFKKYGKRWIYFLVAILLVGFFIRFLVGYFAFRHESYSLNHAKEVVVEDCRGEVIFRRGWRCAQFHEIPKHVVDAVLAAEDRMFFEHSGVNLWSISRAAYRNFFAGEVREGGSTITQQLAKLLMHNDEKRTWYKKMKEALFTLHLESALSKNEIFEEYINNAYFGLGCYGIRSASYRFFNRDVKDLSLYEAVIIASAIKSPSYYCLHRDKLHDRACWLLGRMKAFDMITKAECSLAHSMTSDISEVDPFGRHALGWIINKHENEGKHVKIHSTIDYKLQKKVERDVKNIMDNVGVNWNIDQVAVIMMHKSDIRVMIGGKDVNVSAFNHAVYMRRPIASLAKIFVYLEALNQGWNKWDLISDEDINVGEWSPRNTPGYRKRGDLTLEEAFAYSSNTATVRLANEVGLRKITSCAERFGITIPAECNMTFVLGSWDATLLDMVRVVASILHGTHVHPRIVTSVVCDNEQNDIVQDEEVGIDVSEDVRKEILSMMGAVIRYGTGVKYAVLNKNKAIGMKSGTSSGCRDFWILGFYGDWTIGIWCGNSSNCVVTSKSSGSPVLHIWRSVIRNLSAYGGDNALE